MAKINIDLRTWRTFSELHSFKSYWLKSEDFITQDAEIEVLLNSPNWQPKAESDFAEYHAEVADIRAFHDKNMTCSLRYGCSALLYSLVESQLNLFVDNLGTSPIRRTNGKKMESFLAVFAGHLQANHGWNVQQDICDEYECLKELSAVRNCIMHCWGSMEAVRPSLRADLLSISEKNEGFCCAKTGQIWIEREFIEKEIKACWHFFHALFTLPGWKVDDHWRKEPMG